MTDDQVLHRRCCVGIDERRRVLGIRPQPQHQRVDDPLDGTAQRAAVVAAEHLYAGPDGAPRPVDDGPARLADGNRSRHLEARAHLHSIKLGSVASGAADPNGMFTALLLGIIVLVAGTAAATLFTPDRAIAGDEPVSDEVCERLVRDADILAVRSAFDAMLLRKGLLTGDQLELIRHGTRSRAVVTGMRTTGASREDYWEVELDVWSENREAASSPPMKPR